MIPKLTSVSYFQNSDLPIRIRECRKKGDFFKIMTNDKYYFQKVRVSFVLN